MNARQKFAQWLNQEPEGCGGLENVSNGTNGNGTKGIPTIVKYFLLAIEDGIFDELGVTRKENIISYQGQRYHAYPSTQGNGVLSIELLFQSLLGFSPKIFDDSQMINGWGDLSRVRRGKFAQAIFGSK